MLHEGVQTIQPRAQRVVKAEAVKKRIEDATDEAVRLGLFGAPISLVGDPLFWARRSLGTGAVAAPGAARGRGGPFVGRRGVFC